MKQRLLSLLLCVSLLIGLLAIPGIAATAAVTWQEGATGQYAVLDAVPTDTPLNVGKHIQMGTSGTNFNANGGNVSYLTDGNLDNYRMYYFSNTSAISYWEKITIPLGNAQRIDRLFIASQEANVRQVYVKFYASTDLDTLYDASNLMAETKDGLGADELNILLKGEPKEASYVGVETYLPHANNEKDKYPSMGGFASQFRLRELAVYGTTASTPTEPEGAIKVVTVGDSITCGTHFPSADSWGTAIFENNYPKLVVDKLNAGDPNNTYTLTNLAISGSAVVGNDVIGTAGTNDTATSWYNQSKEKICYADILTIMLGTNDSGFNWDTRKPLYKDIYRQIVADFRAINPNLKLYILTSPYAVKEPYYTNLSNSIVPMQKELASELGATLINVYAHTREKVKADGEASFIDAIDIANGVRLHPGEAGHAFIADVVYAGLTGNGTDPDEENKPQADEYGYYAADAGKYKPMDFIPRDVPLNTGCKPRIGTASDYFNINGGNVSRLTDGTLAESQMYYQSNTSATGYWENITIWMDSAAMVERLLIASDDMATRHVAVKFYASTDLKTLYDESNLMAYKDGIDALNFLLKGEAKMAQYVGISTYIPNVNEDKGKYPGIGGRASQFRFRELAVYSLGVGVEVDSEGFAAADTGKYLVTDEIPADTPANLGVNATYSTTTTKYANAGGDVAYLTDGSLTTGVKKYYNKVDNSVGVWEYFTFALDGAYAVEKLFIGSESVSTRQVHVKFYASEKLENLYDSQNLLAAKDGLTADQLNVILKGDAREARYVGVATYVPDPEKDSVKYPGIGIRASQVRFTELAVYGAFIPERFDETVITADNYETALPDGKNLLKGEGIENKTTDYLQMLKPNGVAWAEAANGGAEGAFNQAALTDGNMNGINTTDSNVASLKDYAAQAFVYDLRGTVNISHLLIHSSKEDKSANYFVNTVEVYVGDDLDTLIKDDNLVQTLTFTMDENVKVFATNPEAGTVKGRYVAFKPNYCQYYVARFGELGVYGTYESGPRDFDREVFAETVITAENYQTALPTGENLLLGNGIANKPAEYLQMLDASGAPWAVSSGSNNGTTNYANIVDGKMNGINTTDSNVGSLRDFSNGAFVYDLRGTVDISQILVHADKESGANYFVSTLEVYVSDKLSTLLSDDSYVQTLSFTTDKNVKVFAPTEELKGRYIAFKPNYCKYAVARFGELGIYGTYEKGPYNFDEQIITGKDPVDYYFAPTGDAGTRLKNFVSMGSEDNADYPLAVLTNGNTGDRMDFNLQTAISDAGNGFEWGGGGLLQQGVPWVVLTYYLEGNVDVNTISVYSPAGSLATAGVEFYVATKQTDLYKPENRVYTTDGDKTYWNAEMEQYYLDPAYDKSQALHTVDLSEQGGVRGRYVGIVITRPYACNKQGWGYARLSEIEVGGARVDFDPVFTDEMHIWTDAATGITANLSRLNNDDMEFFDNISGMTVVKTALTKAQKANVDNNWLVVDGDYGYTIQLKDKSGNIISDEEMGDRYWKISFPSADGTFRMIGLLNGNTVTRVRHSYSSADDKSVVLGNDLKLEETMTTGNNLTFVYLKYNSLENIEKLNGIGDTEFVPSITAGAAERVELTPWWLYDLCMLLLVGCACAVVFVRRARQ